MGACGSKSTRTLEVAGGAMTKQPNVAASGRSNLREKSEEGGERSLAGNLMQTHQEGDALRIEDEHDSYDAKVLGSGMSGGPLRAVAKNLGGTQPLSVEKLMRADAEAAAAEAADPMPEDSGWEDLGGDELEPLLAHTTLIDASWLLKLAQGEAMPERKGVVPPWQLLPTEAKVSLAELRQSQELLPVAVLSYGWAAKGHPDPTGAQLRSLVPALRSMVKWCSDGCALKFGIVWDFMSLPQRGYTSGYDPERDDRTPYQLARFGAGLKSINVWYGHRMVYTLVLDLPMPEGSENMAPVDRRGWCIFERRLSSITKDSGCCLTLSGLMKEPKKGPVHFWHEVITQCKGSRFELLSPDAFEELMLDGMKREEAEAGTGFRFTNGKDATSVCIPQYREAFLKLVSGAEGLRYGGCGWGDDEVAVLCGALLWAHANGATTQATFLGLLNNNLTDASAARLVAVLSVGAAPKLETLWLVAGNALTDAGELSIKTASAARGVEVEL